MRPGDKARCPYTNRVFVVPGIAAAPDRAIAKVTDKPDVRALETRPAPKREMPVKPKPQPVASPKPMPEPAPAPEAELDPEPNKPIPAPAPKPAEEKPAPKPASEKPSTGGSAPTASWSDKSGYVKSPHGGHLVDVRGKSAGSVVRCPFSGKTFKVPSGSN